MHPTWVREPPCTMYGVQVHASAKEAEREDSGLLVLLSLGYCIEIKQQTPPPSFGIVLDVHGACGAFLLVDVDENAGSGLWIGMWMLDKTFF